MGRSEMFSDLPSSPTISQWGPPWCTLRAPKSLKELPANLQELLGKHRSTSRSIQKGLAYVPCELPRNSRNSQTPPKTLSANTQDRKRTPTERQTRRQRHCINPQPMRPKGLPITGPTCGSQMLTRAHDEHAWHKCIEVRVCLCASVHMCV